MQHELVCCLHIPLVAATAEANVSGTKTLTLIDVQADWVQQQVHFAAVTRLASYLARSHQRGYPAAWS